MGSDATIWPVDPFKVTPVPDAPSTGLEAPKETPPSLTVPVSPLPLASATVGPDESLRGQNSAGPSLKTAWPKLSLGGWVATLVIEIVVDTLGVPWAFMAKSM